MHATNDAHIFRIPVGGGGHLHVERYGFGGEPVVLLHGFGTSSFIWRKVAPALAVAQCTAFAVDLFGYGESDRPFDGDFSILAQAEHLDAALTGLHLQSATFVGLDVGALVALRLAFDRPERVRRLVLIGPPPQSDAAGKEIRELQRDTARYALQLSRGLFGSAQLLRPFLTDSVADSTQMPEPLIGRLIAPYVGSDGASQLLALASAISEDDVESIALDQVTQRTLVVRGTRDRRCSRATAESYSEQLPHGHYEHVDEVGHLVSEEDPATLARLIIAFVRTQEPNGSQV